MLLSHKSCRLEKKDVKLGYEKYQGNRLGCEGVRISGWVVRDDRISGWEMRDVRLLG